MSSKETSQNFPNPDTIREMIKPSLLFFRNNTLIVFVFLALLIIPLLSDSWSIYPYEYVQGLSFSLGVLIFLATSVITTTRRKEITRVVQKKLSVAILGFVITGFFSVLFSQNRTVAFWGSDIRHQGFLFLLLCIAFFYLLTLRVQKKHVSLVLVSLPLSAALASIVGIGQVLLGTTPRAFASFGHANFFASFLVATIPITLYFFLEKKHKILSLVSYFLQCFALLLTYSRAGWVAAALAAVFLCGIFVLKSVQKHEHWRAMIFPLLALALTTGFSYASVRFVSAAASSDYLLFSGLQNVSGNPLDDRVKNIADFSSGSGAIRVYIWKDSLDIIKAYPVFGVGPDNMQQVYARFYRDEPMRPDISREMIADRAHNEFLDIIISYGIVGLIFYVGILLSIFIIALRSLFKKTENALSLGAVTASVVGLLFNNQLGFSVTVTAILFWTFLAVICLLTNPSSRKPVTLRIPYPRLFACLSVVFAFALSVRIVVLPFIASHLALAEFSDGETEKTVRNLETSMRLAPQEYYYAFLLSSLYFDQGQQALGRDRESFFILSEEQLDRAHERGLDDLTYYTSLMATYDATGQTELFERAQKKAQESAPNFDL